LASFYFTQGNRTEMARVLQEMEDHHKEFPQAYLTAGDFYARIRDYDMAIKQYQEGAQKDASRRGDYSKREIDVLLRQGKKDQAYAQTLELIKEDPKDTDARAMRATFMLDRGETSQAISELQEVVTAKPQNFVARFNLGRAHAAKGEYEQAIQQYQEALKIRPDYLRPRIAMAEAEMQVGSYDAALKAAQDTEKLSANNGSARLLEAVALMRLQRNDEARKILADLVVKYPQFAEANLEYASLDAREKKYPESRELFHKAYLENPADLRPLFGEAETWVAEKQPEKGLALIQTEVNSHPERSDLLREYASLKASVGQYDSAMGDYRALLQRYKDSPRELAPTYFAISVLERRKGDLKGAIEWMEKAKPLQPNSVALLDSLGEMETQLGRTKEAQQDYRSALALDPNNPMALNNLAFAIAETGTDLDEALTMANKAKQQLPKVDEVNDTLGWIYIKKHMGDPASDIFRDLTARHPDNPSYHYHYCMALSEKGDKADAQKECNMALANNPRSKEEADGVRQLLGKLQ
jgi:tetratricopeptide (TPR) repeat protein